MTINKEAASVYKSLGVRPAITASGATTMYGGSKLTPEVYDVMNKASSVMVNIDELNIKAGKAIADMIGVEAAMITSGSGGGLILQAAACIAGSDPAKMSKLPDTAGMKNEIIIHKSHRFAYDQLYRAAGAKLIDIGDALRVHPWMLENAINDNTAAVAYLHCNFVSRRALPLETVVEIAHSHNVPVIVDAASTLPPRSNFTKHIEQGADLVQFSGGKGVRGPQGTGILIGKKEFVDAAYANAAPHQFIGRGMKVAKEEIIGIVEALRIFLNEDENEQMGKYQKMCEKVLDAFVEVPGLKVEIKHDEFDYLVPTVVFTFTNKWTGLKRDEVLQSMEDENPRIFLWQLGNPDEVGIEPLNLDEEELDIVIEKLREKLIN